MSLFFNLLRILAEQDLQEMDEEEILELLESEDRMEMEEFIDRKAEISGKTLH